MIRGLDHVNLNTAKLDETRAFYVGVLGLAEGPRPALQVPGYWLYAGSQAVLHVMSRNPDDGPPAGALDHFSLAVDDFPTMVARLEAAGLPYRAIDIPGGGRQAFLHDPNGVQVELTWRP